MCFWGDTLLTDTLKKLRDREAAFEKNIEKVRDTAEKKASAKPMALTMFGVNPILCAAFASEVSMS